MALGADTVWAFDAAATASNVNGGAFNASNANFLTDGAATSATGNSPVFSSASYNFVAGDVGYYIYIKSGTNWTPGWYQIASVASNVATLTATVGTAVQRSGSQGKAWYKVNTVAGCATTASPTGATWGIDYAMNNTTSRNTAADLASSDGTTTPSTVTSSSKPFTTKDVGNIIHVNSGTNWTQGFYEIVSVSGNTATLDRAVGIAASISSGTFHVGGGLPLLDTTGNAPVQAVIAGNRAFIKSGTYTVITTFTAGSGGNTTHFEGYGTVPGDQPTGTTRPFINIGASNWSTANDHSVANLRIDSTQANSIDTGSRGIWRNVKARNLSTSARDACRAGDGLLFLDCEFQSVLGNGVNTNGQSTFINCYAHDCGLYGFKTSNGPITFFGCRTQNNAGGGFNCTANTNFTQITDCTVAGFSTPAGTGINIATGIFHVKIFNTTIWGFTTGVAHADTANNTYDDYNNYFNNTSDVSNVVKGRHDVAVTPAFASFTQTAGTTGKFRAGNDAIIDVNVNFTALGVTAGTDYIYIESGTGATAGIYSISSIATTTNPNDTLVLETAPGTNTTADKVWRIGLGHDTTPNQSALAGSNAQNGKGIGHTKNAANQSGPPRLARR